MNNENLLNFMYSSARKVSREARELKPGKVVSKEGYGDDKRDIDQVAEETLVENLPEAQEYGLNIALKPEDAAWGGDAWIKPNGETISGNELQEVDYALIVDQVEGTKNFDNRDRYTTFAAIDPEEPTLNGIKASLAYRWDDKGFLTDGNQSYVFETNENTDLQSLDNLRELEATELNEVTNKTKIRGQAIGLNLHDYADIMQNIISHYDLEEEENNWPSLKADGTTTGDILGSVTDNSIAVDVRAQKERERLPFAQDFAPAAKIAKDAGAKIINEEGKEITTDFTEPGSATAYIALPPGTVSEDIENNIDSLLRGVI